MDEKLSKEDVDSFGFEYQGSYRDGGTLIYEKKFQGQTIFLDYYCENVEVHRPNGVHIYSNKRSHLKGEFNGDIKSKEELSMILGMIGFKEKEDDTTR